jgi:hypothetical protein
LEDESDQLVNAINAESNPNEKTRLVYREQQLRDEEKQLRDLKLKLMDEKKEMPKKTEESRILQKLATLVSMGFHDVNITATTAESLVFPPRSDDKITRYTMQLTESTFTGGGDSQVSPLRLQAWVLPANNEVPTWPHITMYSKQHKALGGDVLFRRVDDASVGREIDTIEQLLKGNAAIWIGLPGIGKSASSIIMLIQCLELLKGSVKKLNQIYYRAGDNVFVFQRNASTDELEVRDVSKKEWEDDPELEYGFHLHLENIELKRILIVELEEDENNPQECGFYTSSSTNVFSKLHLLQLCFHV